MRHKLILPRIKQNYLRNLLQLRGIADPDIFITPEAFLLQQPHCLSNIEEGRLLLEENLDRPMFLIADCDVDGFTSAAIIYQYIKAVKPDAEIDYAVHEHKQHGLEDITSDIINSDKEYGLVIVPDAGSNDFEYIETLGERGIKTLILDHHILNEDSQVSKHCVLINNQTSPKYENKDLTGAGVTWQFCRYLDSCWNVNHADDFIDLAALGIISDMGSALSLENRYIVSTGLANIKNYFFKSACEKQDYSMGGKINYVSVAFYITPMINSMIRVGTMPEKRRLFLAFIDGHALVPCNKRGAKGTMEEVAIESLRECTNTKSKQDKITTAAMEQIGIRIFNNNLLDNKLLFVELEEEDDFPQEVNGLVAMKLSSKYQRPTLLGRLGPDGNIKGSIRGLSNCDMGSMRDFLLGSELFEYVSGHDNAAGFSVPYKKLTALHSYANKELETMDFTENVYEVEFERYANDSDLSDLVCELGSVPEIWGQNNNTPLIYVGGINIKPSEIRVMGRNQDTISFEKNGVKYIKFFAKDFIEKMNEYDEIQIEVVCKASLNEWMGKTTPQLMIENYEIRNAALAF